MKNKILVAAGAAVVLSGGVAAYHHAPFFPCSCRRCDSWRRRALANRSRWTRSRVQEEFRHNPHVRAFYELTVQEFANGPDKVDVAAFEEKSFAIFRELGASIGGSPAGMQDHLKGIPRELIGIVRDDPHTLDNYDNFTTALMGPP